MKRIIFTSEPVEARNCLEEARMAMSEHNGKVNAQIGEAVAHGLFVVVERYAWLCKATDAVAGEGKHVLAICPSREEALTWLNEQYEASKLDPDSDYTVLPMKEDEPRDAGGELLAGQDEVPF